uniref:Uncharacterized protein n=1 Tax=Meloidogyne hapla TaxID=6305 RepID=A0A1I8C273_MELHA
MKYWYCSNMSLHPVYSRRIYKSYKKRNIKPSEKTQKDLMNYYKQKDPNFKKATEQVKENGKNIHSILGRIDKNLLVDYIRGLLALYKFGEVNVKQLGVRMYLFKKMLKSHQLDIHLRAGRHPIKSVEQEKLDFELLKIKIDNFFLQKEFDDSLKTKIDIISLKKIAESLENKNSKIIDDLIKDIAKTFDSKNNSNYNQIKEIFQNFMQNEELVFNKIENTNIENFLAKNKSNIIQNWISEFFLNVLQKYGKKIIYEDIKISLMETGFDEFLVNSETIKFMKGEYRIAVNEKTVDKI